MSLARILYIIGIVFMVYAIISGIKLTYNVSDLEVSSYSRYTFKGGLFLIGLILMYIGRRSKKKDS